MELLIFVAPLQGAFGIEFSALPVALAGVIAAAVLVVLALREAVGVLPPAARRPALRLLDGGKTSAGQGFVLP